MTRFRRMRPRSPDAEEQQAQRVSEQAADPGMLPRAGTPGAQDVDDVRLHRDERAAQLTEALGAPAVTVGRNVFLSPSGPDPASDAGRRMLAHELTHVVQQRR